MNIELLVAISVLLIIRLINLYPFKSPFPSRPLIQAALLSASHVLLFQMNSLVLLLLVLTIALVFAGELMNRRSSHDEATSLIVLAITLLGTGILTRIGDGITFRETAVSLFSSINRHIPLADLSLSATDATNWLILVGILLLANEANLLVRAVFRYCGLTPERQALLRREARLAREALDEDGSLDPAAIKGETPADRSETLQAPINDGAFRAGRVIGFLERWLMLLVILGSDDLSALAFIIAAKGLARMKQLEDRAFAEYMLIGTLMSALLSLVVGLWIERYL